MMIYKTAIYYQDDSYVPKALKFLANKFDKDFKINIKVDDVLIPINKYDMMCVKSIKGLTNSNSTLDVDYVVIQDSLIVAETMKYWQELKTHIKKDFWVISERSLEE